MKRSRIIFTRSQAKAKLSAVLSRNLTRTKTRNLSSDSIPEEEDEDKNDIDPSLSGVAAIAQPIDLKNDANEIISSRDLHFLRKDNLLYFTDIVGNPVNTQALLTYLRDKKCRD